MGARVLTGFFLAGIYPVGMKLAASWYREGLGWAIGLLVGALVLGTAFPHLLRTAELPWRPVVLATSGLAVVGGALAIFSRLEFRRASFGYFGHMWELYAFWAFVPLAVAHVLRSELGGSR